MAMQVLTVASTCLDYDALRETGYVPHSDTVEMPAPFTDAWQGWINSVFEEPIDELHEAAGRGCYESWNRPNPATATNETYLGHIIDVDHLSVLGHGHVTFHVKGVSRALLLELERHAQRYSINFSVLSQRYVNHGVGSDIEVVVPPLFTGSHTSKLQAHFFESQRHYDDTFRELRALGHSVKEARGAARAFLPENTETRFFVTGSIRAWRNIIEQRLSDAADAEIREFARLVLIELSKLAPNSMQDLIEKHEIEGDN